jgi:hypothetical protein
MLRKKVNIFAGIDENFRLKNLQMLVNNFD